MLECISWPGLLWVLFNGMFLGTYGTYLTMKYEINSLRTSWDMFRHTEQRQPTKPTESIGHYDHQFLIDLLMAHMIFL